MVVERIDDGVLGSLEASRPSSRVIVRPKLDGDGGTIFGQNSFPPLIKQWRF